uniref:Vexin n=1 Tax=Sphenodon punctatus TaxID=8508 RepID=A0A8D0L0R0_SPHPU
MHQIYSCSDENLEVFTVISSKCEYMQRVLSFVWSVWREIIFQSNKLISLFNCIVLISGPHPPGPPHSPSPGSTPAVCGGKRSAYPSLISRHKRHSRKNTDDLPLPQEAEASLPLTGSSLCGTGTPSLLRKMWMKHKKKSEYLGATNSAFEAD